MQLRLNRNELRNGKCNDEKRLIKRRDFNFRICFRQAETKRKLEQLRSEDVSFESMVEGNDLIFGASLQESRLTLGDVEKQNVEKAMQQGAHTKTG